MRSKRCSKCLTRVGRFEWRCPACGAIVDYVRANLCAEIDTDVVFQTSVPVGLERLRD